MATALKAAERMRDRGVDPHFVAAALQFLHQRCEMLEALYETTDRYLRFGMPEHELLEMHAQLNRLREASSSHGDENDDDEPLPI